MKYIPFLIFFLYTYYTFSQDKENARLDSLKKTLTTTLADSLKIKTQVEIGELEPILRMKYWDSLKLFSEKINYLISLGTIYNNIGYIYQKIENNDVKALEYYETALSLHRKNNNKAGQALTLYNIGIVFFNQGDIKKSLEFYFQSLKISEEIDDKERISSCLNNIGGIYQKQGESEKALEFYVRNLEIKKSVGNKKGIATALKNVGYIYQLKGDHEKAMEFYQQSLKLFQEISNKRGIAYSLNIIGSLYEDKNDFKNALSKYVESLHIREDINDLEGIAISNKNIGSLYYKMGDLQNAIKYGNASLISAQKLGYPDIISSTSKLLFMTYKQNGNYNKALEMHELYIVMRDSINNSETRKATLKKQFQYDFEKKELEIKTFAKVEKEKLELKATADKRQQIIITYCVLAGLVFVLIFALFIYRSLQQNKRANKVISEQKAIVEEQKQIVEHKQKEILDSIRYAKRIQTALIPSEKYIHKVLKAINKRQA